MEFYDVFLSLHSHGRKIGRTSVQLRTSSPFMAAREAEKSVNGRYGQAVICKTIKVIPVSEEEFLYQMAA